MVTPTQILNARPVPEIEGQADLFAQEEPMPEEQDHTFNGDCPLCGPCEAAMGHTEIVNGVPESDGCCLCDQEDAEDAEDAEQYA